MKKRFASVLAVATVLFGLGACTNKKVTNPIASLDSKQPDKVLFDRSMDAMKHGKYDVARMSLQVLINTYPDSEYVARAKLAIGDSWYAEGGSASLTQAENEYKDFETFFPNMPEAAEAQLKIANIHFRQMEKPDRDYTHAKRAEEEYRNLIITYPDSKLVPEAKKRLLEVQEVLAEREFEIGHFYYSRESWNAAQARLQTLVDTYPLYSGADEALFLLGSSYEREIENIRNVRTVTPDEQKRGVKGLTETQKGFIIKNLTDKASASYSRILTRYPVMARAHDAKLRLEALHRPVPTPTPEAIAENKREDESRQQNSFYARMKLMVHRGPDLSSATHVGEPTLTDPPQTSAPQLARDANMSLFNAIREGNGKVTAEPVKEGAIPESQPIPRSDSATSTPADANGSSGDSNNSNAVPELLPITNGNSQPADSAAPAGATPPPQMNQLGTNPGTDPNAQAQTSGDASNNGQAGQQAQSSDKDNPVDYSTSKKKKKKGLGKLNPF